MGIGERFEKKGIKKTLLIITFIKLDKGNFLMSSSFETLILRVNFGYGLFSYGLFCSALSIIILNFYFSLNLRRTIIFSEHLMTLKKLPPDILRR